MFTDEEKRTYHNIKAPDTLYQRITAKSKTLRRVWYGLAAMAASLVLIVTSVVMQGQGDIIVNGRKLKDSVEFYVATAAMERSVFARRLSMMVMRHDRATNSTISRANQ